MNMEGERLAFMDVVQLSFTDGGPSGGHLIPGLWDEYSDLSSPGPYAPDVKNKRLLMPVYMAFSMAQARRDST